ncbi:MAG: hypothetical protein HW388_451 [Dehalococcoidia bacterium]|nr:hypothetical protein [Dehalococcoidia bacterium]
METRVVGGIGPGGEAPVAREEVGVSYLDMERPRLCGTDSLASYGVSIGAPYFLIT